MAARFFLILALCLPVWVHATPVVVGQLAPAIELPLLSVQAQSASASLLGATLITFGLFLLTLVITGFFGL